MSQSPHFILVIGDFNVRSSSWWKNDLKASEGNQVDAITSFYGLNQLIFEPTNILPKLSSCIDLIFINQNYFIMDSGLHAFLHPNCHHQLIYAKLNLKIQLKPSNGRNYLKMRMLMSSYSSSTRPCLIFFIILFQIKLSYVMTRNP